MIIRDLPRTRIVTVDRVTPGDMIYGHESHVYGTQMHARYFVIMDSPVSVIAVNPRFTERTAAISVRHAGEHVGILETGIDAHVLIERK